MERKPVVFKKSVKSSELETDAPPPEPKVTLSQMDPKKKDPACPSDQKATLGKMDPEKKAVRIQDLGDRVGVAIKQFESAQQKFESGADSHKEWRNIIKLLNSQIKDVEKFLAIAHHNLGVIHAGKRELEAAQELFEKAIAINPDYAVAHYNLALIFHHQGDIIKAKELLARAKELGYCPPSEKKP